MEVEVDRIELTRSQRAADAAAAEEERLNSCASRSEDRSLTTRHPSAEASGEESGRRENDRKEDDRSQAKKKCRRKRKAGEHHRVAHRWKPYAGMTWEERQEHDEQETLRANMKRSRRFASGQPMAPYNTTQFLMEQHDGDRTPRDNSLVEDRTKTLPEDAFLHAFSEVMDDDQSESEEDATGNLIFEDWNFKKDYERYRSERLQGMSKDELVRECLTMEAKLEEILKENDSLKKNTYCVNKLREDNERLAKENEQLKSMSIIADVREKLATECIG